MDCFRSFFLSILAMQGRTEKDIELINYIKDRILKDRNFFYTFYRDTNPSECKRRLLKKSSCDRIERKGVGFHSIVYDRHSNLLKNERNVYVFNGGMDIVPLHKEIVNNASKLIKL